MPRKELTDEEIAVLLERFDQTEERLQRLIVVRLIEDRTILHDALERISKEGNLTRFQCEQIARKAINSVKTHSVVEESKDAKVAHVKKARQIRSHTCHWPGCDKQCEPAKWGCLAHWRMIPRSLQKRIWDAYRVGQEETGRPSAEYIKVAREVQQWIKDNYPVIVEDHDHE